MDNNFFKKPILKDLFTILLQNKANKWNIIENKTEREKELVFCRTNRDRKSEEVSFSQGAISFISTVYRVSFQTDRRFFSLDLSNNNVCLTMHVR